MLTFRGIQKTTLVDYPGEIACTLFLGGCNWRCGYCFNRDLALNQGDGPCLSEAEVLEFLATRRGFLDGVVVTGGEPLLHYPAVLEFLRTVKALGFKVKLDTNGSFPAALRDVLAAGAVDYVAMDIKAPWDKYEQVARRTVDAAALQESVRLIQQSGVAYEFRTTVAAEMTLEDFEQIGRWLAGSKKYCLQPLRTDVPLLDDDFAATHHAPAPRFLHQVAARLQPYVEKLEIRGTLTGVAAA